MILDQLYILQDLNVFRRLLGQKIKGGKEEAGEKIMYEKNVVASYRLAGMNGNIVSIQII